MSADYLPSPVPSDSSLRPHELPFTAFGQFGEGNMDIRVFDQDAYWVNIKGEAFRLEEMSPEYRANVIAFLHRHVEYYHAVSALRDAAELVIGVYGEEPSGTVLARQLGAPAVVDLDPQPWLESTPLMRRLRGLS